MHRARTRCELPKEIDQIILDRSSKKRYLRGRFLGKGGFAKCYELTDMQTKEVYAGKIVPKSKLTKPHQKEKMSMEIAIHRGLNHSGVVGFHGYFEDDDYIYILLELCKRRSLMELHKRRKALTEPEVRYYIKATVEACQYLHHNNIIHRDLKLGNLFLNNDMEIKIGDFGLATRVDFDGERKKTLCGTPNYIAPEVLNKKGHSFEVDVWSLGCILYTLLVGKPPFETCNLTDTYMRIKRNEYYIPPKVSHPAQLLIIKLLRPDPTTRPTIDEILDDDFFKGFTPSRLPVSSLTMSPRFVTEQVEQARQTDQYATRKPLLELNSGTTSHPRTRVQPEIRNGKIVPGNKRKSLGVKVIDGESVMLKPGEALAEGLEEEEAEIPKDFFLSDLRAQIVSCINSKPCEKHFGEDNAEDPASTPVYWVSKWVDYSDKYGLGYQLCDNSAGVLFNDATRMLLNGDGDTLQYTDKTGKEVFYTLKGYPDDMHKKVTLLKFFLSYMNDHLLKTGSKKKEEEETSRMPFTLPFLREWFRTNHGMVLHLSNGILQINFFKDHTKIILCPRMSAVTYIDEKKNFRTFPLKNIEKYGCRSQIVTRLTYAKNIIDRMTGQCVTAKCATECLKQGPTKCMTERMVEGSTK